MRFAQFLNEATVLNFAQDFEQVLNLMVGGSWTIKDQQEIPSGAGRSMGFEAQYRGMSENGRHYEVTTSIMNQMLDIEKMPEYEFKTGSKNIIFSLGEIIELGKNFQAFDRSHPTIRVVHDERSDSFFQTPIQMAQKIKQLIAEYESRHDSPEPLDPLALSKLTRTIPRN